ncbi:MAG: hypothetical protein R3D70_12715 [Rhizobiaceae bacterium]
MGSGDLGINDITLTNVGDDDGLVFDLLALTGGFDNGGAGSDDLIGAQTHLAEQSRTLSSLIWINSY